MKEQNKIRIDETTYETEIPESYRGKEFNGMPDPYEVRAIIPGTIVEVGVQEGQRVIVGKVVLILEAMKMLNEMETEVDGKVSKISVSPGDIVEKNQLLMKIVP